MKSEQRSLPEYTIFCLETKFLENKEPQKQNLNNKPIQYQ